MCALYSALVSVIALHLGIAIGVREARKKLALVERRSDMREQETNKLLDKLWPKNTAEDKN